MAYSGKIPANHLHFWLTTQNSVENIRVSPKFSKNSVTFSNLVTFGKSNMISCLHEIIHVFIGFRMEKTSIIVAQTLTFNEHVLPKQLNGNDVLDLCNIAHVYAGRDDKGRSRRTRMRPANEFERSSRSCTRWWNAFWLSSIGWSFKSRIRQTSFIGWSLKSQTKACVFHGWSLKFQKPT